MPDFVGEVFFDNGILENIVSYYKTTTEDICILESGGILYIRDFGTEKERILDNHYNDMSDKIDHIFLFERD